MATPQTLVECSRCGAGFDVSSMKPDTRFRCENCGAYLRVPRRRRSGLWIGAAAAAAGLGVVVVLIVLFSQNGSSPGEPGPGTRSETGDGKDATPPEKKPDLVALTVENLTRNAASGEVKAVLELARFCGKHEPYREQARDAYRRVLADDPEHEEALKALDLACCEGLHVPRSWHRKLVESTWYDQARKLLEQEVKNKQMLCDLGLSYAYAPPFVLVRERNRNEAEDRIDRRKARAILDGLAPAFNRLVGRELGVDATSLHEVIPIFWYRTDRAEPAFEDAMQIDLLEQEKGIKGRNPHWCMNGEDDITRLTLSPLAEQAACELVEMALTSGLSGSAEDEKAGTSETSETTEKNAEKSGTEKSGEAEKTGETRETEKSGDTEKAGEGNENEKTGENGKDEIDEPKAGSGPSAPPAWVIQGLAAHLGRLKMQPRKFQDPVVVHDVADAPTLRSLARDPEHTRLKDVVALTPRKLPKEFLEMLKERGIEVEGVRLWTPEPDVPSRDAWGLVRFFLKDDPDRRSRFLDYLKRLRSGERNDKAFLAAFGHRNRNQAVAELDRTYEAWLESHAK